MSAQLKVHIHISNNIITTMITIYQNVRSYLNLSKFYTSHRFDDFSTNYIFDIQINVNMHLKQHEVYEKCRTYVQ